MQTIRTRLTFANLVACLALFVALGGASYAATRLPKDSVGSTQLMKNAVTAAKLKRLAPLLSQWLCASQPVFTANSICVRGQSSHRSPAEPRPGRKASPDPSETRG